MIGSGYVHVYNYVRLIEDYFDKVLLVANKTDPSQNIDTVTADFSLRNPLNRFTTVARIKKTIRQFNPDVIHLHQANSYAWFGLHAAGAFRIPTVLTCWGSDVLLIPQKNWLFKKIVRYNLSHADALTSDSVFMADRMQQFVPGKKLDITIANFGINVEAIDLPKENLIYSNRLHKNFYRIDKIILSFHRFIQSADRKDWKLVIAATGEETPVLKRMVADMNLNDHVVFAGWVDKAENTRYYAKAKVFVSVPESDATAISLLEAMAMGCTPVLSDLPANREWVTDGANGVIVSDINGNFFERAQQLDSERAVMENKKIIAERGTKGVNRKKFLDLYERLLSVN